MSPVGMQHLLRKARWDADAIRDDVRDLAVGVGPRMPTVARLWACPTRSPSPRNHKLAARTITRAVQAGMPARWVAADEVYDTNPALRTELETQQLGLVLAVACDQRLPTPPRFP
ncbi:hypothetical protein [Parasphingorhabdus pacifica]